MWLRASAIGGLALAVACGGSGGYSGSSATGGPSPTPTGSSGVVTITADGVSPKTVRIEAGQQVQFINSNTRVHQINSTPHSAHTDCPPVNEVSAVSPGQSRMTGVLDRVGTCGFHDHRDPDNERFRGTILVGVADPGQPPRY